MARVVYLLLSSDFVMFLNWLFVEGAAESLKYPFRAHSNAAAPMPIHSGALKIIYGQISRTLRQVVCKEIETKTGAWRSSVTLCKDWRDTINIVGIMIDSFILLKTRCMEIDKNASRS